MPKYTEEIHTHVTITHEGHKEVRKETIILKDGEEVGRSNHRFVVNAQDDVPAEIASHIEAKKGKQPKK